MRRATIDTAISALALLSVLSALVAFDPRVRDHVSTILSHDKAGGMAAITERAGEIGAALFMSARDQSMTHAPLLVFGVVAAVLVMFMLRT